MILIDYDHIGDVKILVYLQLLIEHLHKRVDAIGHQIVELLLVGLGHLSSVEALKLLENIAAHFFFIGSLSLSSLNLVGLLGFRACEALQ
jgi:hypothetical protein